MRKIASLSCIEVTHSLGGTKKTDSSPLHVILFHGFGADAYDLQSLAEVMKAPTNESVWLFPQGVLQVPIGPGWTGRAWWPINMARLEAAARTGDYDLGGERPEGIDSLRKRVDEMIAELKVPWSRIVLGGFSQGGMLATDTFLRAPEQPAGLMVLSGALINKTEWKTLAEKRAGASFFLSHGRSDLVLPYRTASQLESLLTSAGLKGSLFSFEGGHEIPWNVIEKANAWLKTLPL